VIAEAGVNHDGSLEKALALVDLAASAGADVVKFQTFSAKRLVTKSAPKAKYQTDTTDPSESQFEMLSRLELSPEDHVAIMQRCSEVNIEFMSTPFDAGSVRLLVKELGVRRLKLGSGELTNAPLLLETAHTGLPLILSTGMSTLADVEAALGVLAFGYLDGREPSRAAFARAFASPAGQEALRANLTLLHCTTEYPSLFEEVNLRAMATLHAAFGVECGFSDHTPGIAMPIAAAALGATVIEKHFTLDPSLPGPDHKASLSPKELHEMIAAIRAVELALGTGVKIPMPSEAKNVAIARKSLTTLRPVAAGERFSPENLGVKRPGTGVSPFLYWDYLRREADRGYGADETL